MQEIQDHPSLLTTREVARIFRVDMTTVKRWIRQGSLEAVELPHVETRRHMVRIKRETVDKILRGEYTYVPDSPEEERQAL